MTTCRKCNTDVSDIYWDIGYTGDKAFVLPLPDSDRSISVTMTGGYLLCRLCFAKCVVGHPDANFIVMVDKFEFNWRGLK